MKMYKNALIAFLTLALCACAAQKNKPFVPLKQKKFVYYYSHPDHGELKSSDIRYQRAVNECNDKVYSEGVDVDGTIIRDPKKLNSISAKFMFGFVKEQVNKKTRISEDEMLDEAWAYVKEAPSYIGEIRKKEREFKSCLSYDKKYKKVRLETYNSATGELIDTTEYK